MNILRYPGGKSKRSIREKILSYAPEFDEYREPFVGGGGIYFHIDRSKRRWINDADKHLISVYKALQERPEEFITLCRSIAPQAAGEAVKPPIYNQRLKEVFDSLKLNEECDQALRYYFVNRTVWAGRVNYNLPSRLYFSNPTGWNITKTSALEDAASLLANTKITCGDYADLLFAEGENVWIYLDPPYVVNTNLAKTSQLYMHNFDEQDHIRLHDLAKQCPHKILISYDANDFILDLYKDFNCYKDEWIYCGTSCSEKKIGKEVIITNYGHSRDSQ